MFDVNPSLIRFWESKFDILKPHKNKKGNRMFTPADVDNLKLIYHLVKEKGMTLSGAAKRLRENREGAQRDMEVVDRLLGIRSLLMEIRQELRGEDEEEVSFGQADDWSAEDAGVEAAAHSGEEPVASQPEEERDDTVQAESRWLNDELDRLERLDRGIHTLEREDGLPAGEADLLLEDDDFISLDDSAYGDAAKSRENDEGLFSTAQQPIATFTETFEQAEGDEAALSFEIDAEEFEAQSEMDFMQASAMDTSAQETGDNREEEPKRPYIVEQTLF